MKLETIIVIAQALNNSGVRFLVAGGVAVNLHGYTRVTQDLDIVIELSFQNTLNALTTLKNLGYKPQIPVKIEDFADKTKRQDWITNKHMQLFSLVSETYPDTTLDIFVTEPFSFEDEYQQADRYEITPGIELKTVTPQTLIDMKQNAGRPRDHDDIQHLEWIIEERQRENSNE